MVKKTKPPKRRQAPHKTTQDHLRREKIAAVIAEFKNELKAFEISKGTIRFPVDKPLPAILLKKMVKARVAQLEKKKR